MKKQLLLLVMMLLPMAAMADAVEINGIYYNLIQKSKSAEVVSGNYKGDIVIPEAVEYEGTIYSVELIAENAFRASAFNHNPTVTSIVIPSSIKRISKNAFQFCRSLQAVYISDLSAWCNINFGECSSIGNEYAESISNPLYYAQHLYLNGEEITTLSIPEDVTEIKDYAFMGDSLITSVSVPGSVKKMGNYAFYSCKGIKNINMEYGISTIGHSGFGACESITSLKIPHSVSFIDADAFSGCFSIKDVELSNGLAVISDYLFYGCRSLTSINIPDGISTIGSFAFHGCSELEFVHIPGSVKKVGMSAFSLCDNLKTVSSDDLDSWCKIKFEFGSDWADCYYSANPLWYTHHLYVNNQEVTEVTIPNQVDTLGFNFINCQEIKKITLHNGLKELSRGAFQNCTGITSINIPLSVETIGIEAFAGCIGLSNLELPANLKKIGQSAFFRCSNLISIKIPEGITSIEGYLFRGCSSLVSISLPSTVERIQDQAFSGCSSLKDFYCLASKVPSFQTQASLSPFRDSYVEFSTLHVPESSISNYKVANYWSDFGNIIALTKDEYTYPKCATPTIIYKNGKLTFRSDTDGADFISEIVDVDIKKHYDIEIQLTATYNISVYATKQGYEKSEVATATLCWIDQQPTTEGMIDGIANVPAKAVLIQSIGGQLTIEGANDGERISVYSINGTQAGSAISQNGQAVVGTNLQPGSVAIVKIGEKSVKVVVK